MKKALLILSLILVTGTASAHIEDLPDPGILPGNPFYFLDILSERIGIFFTFGDVKKAEKHLDIAAERLAEAQILAEQGKTKRAEKAAEKYQRRVDKALAKIEEARKDGKDTNRIFENIAEAMVKHQAVLAKVYEQVPEAAKEAIQKVMEKSARRHETALEAISGEKQKEVRDRVKEETKDAEEHLEELRERGIPIPDMKKGRTNDDTKDNNENNNNKGKSKDAGKP